MLEIYSKNAVYEKALLMGNEAIARGAIEAGVDLAAAYPGTPSSEIGEALANLAKKYGFYFEWSANEKVAFDVAAGASIIGARSLVAMKNAGLNVAMDSFMALPYTGVKGALVVVVADDPNAHYSSTEQDTRIAAKYAEIMCLEPMDQQEAKEMTREAFSISERLELPVLLRSVTRVSHASGDVTFGRIGEKSPVIGFNKHWKLPYRWALYGPPNVIKRHVWLHEQMPAILKEVEKSPFNSLFLMGADGSRKSIEEGKQRSRLGIIASGLGCPYALEALESLKLGCDIPFLKIGTPFPLPQEKVLKFLGFVENVLIVEEGDPLVEEQIKSLVSGAGLDVSFFGKTGSVPQSVSFLKGYGTKGNVLPLCGEINTDMVSDALKNVLSQVGGFRNLDNQGFDPKGRLKKAITPRSSTLCPGCPHLGSFFALREVLRKTGGVNIVNGDIGCYEQGGYGIFSRNVEGNSANSRHYRVSSPYEILDTTHVMGSGIGLAMGQTQAGYKDGKVFAVAGDSTFFHATLPALANAVCTKADITFLVLDNSWTSMTGHQPSPATGRDAFGRKNVIISIEEVVKALGVEKVFVVDAYNLDQAEVSIQKAMDYIGPSVVILRRECALQVQRKTSKGSVIAGTRVKESKCIGCRLCLELGCPAVTFNSETKKAGIDGILCVDCGLCAQVCPKQAILAPSIPDVKLKKE